MLTITPLPAFTDNYIWVLENAGETWVVDPGESAPVIQYLDKSRLSLDGILITHHHADHVGGVEDLLGKNTRVIGPGLSKLPYTNEPVLGGEEVHLAGLRLQAVAVPGHTLNHMAFFAEPQGAAPILFCGDTLFVAGCGRLFEGTPAEMLESLQTLARLPDETRVYCGHEYTLANLSFAEQAEPGNEAIPRAIEAARQLRDQNQPTVPSTIEREKHTNPFLRAHLPQLRESMEQHSGQPVRTDVESFRQIRLWKDKF